MKGRKRSEPRRRMPSGNTGKPGDHIQTKAQSSNNRKSSSEFNSDNLMPLEAVSERRFREMVDALPAAIYTTDAEGRLTHFNPAAVEFSGRIPELGTDNWCVSWKLYRADGTPMPHDQCPMAIALKEGRILRGVEAIAERPDGSRVWFTPYPTPLRDAEGKIVGGINMLVDITERKQAEEARTRLAAIVESSDDAIMSKDLSGILTSWNNAAEHLFGYSAQEAIGRPVTMLIPPDREDEEPSILEHISRGETIDHYETVRRRKDGSLIEISLTISPIKDAQGRIIGASKIARDITKRKQVEQALRGSEERFRTLVSVITDVLWVTDATGAFTQPQPAWEAYTGQTWEEHRGFGWAEALHPEDRDRVREVWLRACRERALYESGGRVWHAPTQQWRHYVARATPIFEAAGSVREWVGTCTDIEEMTRADQALHRLNDELEGRVEDRTRELLTSQEQLRALATELNLTEQRERQRLASELHDYLAQLLALSKIKLIQAKRQAVVPSVVKAMTEVQEIMEQALAYTRTLVAQLSPLLLKEFGLPIALKWLTEQMQQRTLTVSLELESETLPLPEDQAMLLFQSVRELLMNVLKHAETNQAKIAVTHAGGTLRITVSDQGAGFDLAAAKTRVVPAFGLFSIRERMRALGGDFELRSSPGQGTQATLILPLTPKTANDELSRSNPMGRQKPRLAEEPVSEFKMQHSEFMIQNSELPQRASRLTRNTSRVRVLLADDHTMVRQGLRSVLDAYQDISVVGEAVDGEEVVELARRLSPDVIVMDVNMPRMDGIEATRRIKAQLPGTLIVGLSLSNANQIEPLLRQAGASGYMSKDAAGEQLYEAIMVAVKNRSQSSESPEALAVRSRTKSATS